MIVWVVVAVVLGLAVQFALAALVGVRMLRAGFEQGVVWAQDTHVCKVCAERARADWADR